MTDGVIEDVPDNVIHSSLEWVIEMVVRIPYIHARADFLGEDINPALFSRLW